MKLILFMKIRNYRSANQEIRRTKTTVVKKAKQITNKRKIKLRVKATFYPRG